jgi:hypothetical protein
MLLLVPFLSAWRLDAATCLSTPSGLVGWWPGDGNAHDIIGTNNGVLLGGASATNAGFNGSAFQFDGTNASVRFPDSPVFHPTNLTIEAWVNFSSLDSSGFGAPAGEQYMVFKQNSRPDNFEGFYLGKTRVSSNDKFTFQVSSATGQPAEIDSATNIVIGTWYHVAGVRGSNYTQLYVNGKLQGQISVTFTQDYGSLPLYFGTSGQTNLWDRRLAGMLDEVSLYNRALSSNEIAAAYAAGAVGKCKAVAFTAQPQNQSVLAGASTAFTGTASGVAPISYQWLFNGAALGGATATNLLLTSIQGSNAGNYSLVASNVLGAATSSVAVLAVIVPPVVTNPPASRTNVAGTTALFGVGVSGNGTLSYQWQFNGANITGATGTSLAIGNAQPANAGNYTVAVTNAAGGTTSAVALLTIWVPPTAATQPQSQTNIQGTTAFFSASANGTAPFGYQWQFNGASIPGATDATLNVPNVQPINAGNYAMVITNGAGAVTSAIAVLTVWVPPSISSQPQSQTNVQGTTATFNAGASGTAPFAYQWQFNGVSISAATASTLTVNNVQPTDAGNYTVAVTNSAGSITSVPAALTVWVPPGISTQPQSQTNVQGTTATFSLAASGTTPFSYQWQFNGGALGGATGSSLTLSNVQPSDAGNYSVVVTNSAGAITSGVAALTVWVPPGISSQPQSQTNVQGTTATFGVAASGTTPFSYQWQFNGAGLNGATGTSLSLTNVQPANAGNYTVVVTNSAGSITSAAVTLTVWVPPTISAQPVSTTNVQGTTATFSVGASGTAPFAYQWQLGGTALGGATGASLSLSNVQPTDAGNYTVIITNSAGSITSAVAALTVWVPAGIAAQPQSRTNVQGTTATFGVLASGTAPYAYQWQVNGSSISGATTATLAVGNVQSTNAGNYTVIVTNSAGSVTSAVAVLTVWVPPTISAQPLSGTNVQGTTATFNVSANGTTPFAYQWQLNGVALNGATSASLSVSNVQSTDAGNYTVVVTNVGGSISSAIAVLTVWIPPTISAQPVSRTNVQGTTATFNVSANGTTPYAYQWQLNGAALNGATSASLSVSNVQSTDAGNYTVIVTNSGGSITSGVAVLTVWIPPTVSTQPQSRTNVQGTTATFNVSANGTVPFAYQWQINGGALGGATGSSLSVSNVQPTDAGNYTVMVTNVGGSTTSAVAALTVWVPPGISTQPLSRTNVRGTTASFSVAASGTAPFSYQWNLNGLAKPGATASDLTISNVQPTDAGNYTVLVTNSAGAITSGIAILTVLGPAEITANPASQTNLVGTTGTFTVNASGTAPLSYQWRFNDADIPGANGSSLTLTGIQTSNAGNYTVVITNIANGVTSSVALLTVWVPPAITAQPQSVTNVQGTMAGLTAGVSGTAPLSYQWLFNGAPLTGATGTNLSIGNIQPTNGGNYSLVATNLAGTNASALAVVTVWVPPSVPTPPLSQTNVTGTTATFSASASGTTPLAYQWLFNGAPISGATTTNLTVSNVQTTNAGNYTLVATNGAGAITSAVAVLTVTVPPTITSQPQSVAAIAGTNVNFNVTAAGTTPFSYQWALNGTLLPGATFSSITVSNILPTNAGNYTVLITNVAGSITSSPALLTVLGSPTFTAQPSNRTNVQGTTAGFSAITTGTLPQAYQWQLGGVNLTDGSRVIGSSSNTLTVLSVQAGDTGNYTMVASNIVGMATSVVATLTVLIPVSIVSGPTNTSVPAGSNATLTVTAAGTTPFRYQWQFKGLNLAGATNSSLNISNAQTSNAGSYAVVITNVVGSVTSAPAVLSVVVPPVYWYVDNALTNSANNGTNWSSAWTNLNSVVWGANGVKAGHTLYISGGSISQVYTDAWTINAAGVPGSPVRIALDATNSAHSGTVIFDYGFTAGTANFAGITCLRDYVTIDGSVGAARGFAFVNLWNPLDQYNAVAIYAGQTTGVIIDHVTFTNCNNPMRLTESTGFRVCNCDLRQVRGEAAIMAAGCTGNWDANLVYSNSFEMLYNLAVPPGGVGPFYGPDGVQSGDGISIFGNVFHEVISADKYTSNEHPDFVQAVGDHTKIYGNEFINIGDSGVDFGLYSSPTLNGLWIYNNLFRIEQPIDTFPEYIRIYNGAPTQMNDIKIFNNTFVDNTTWMPIFISNFGNPTATGNEIKNNIFYNCGGSPFTPIIYFADSCGLSSNSFTFDGNIFYTPNGQGYISFGAEYHASDWVNRIEPHGKTNAPVFARYTQSSPTNDYHLSSADSTAINGGVDLSAYTTVDKDFASRTLGPAWDIGAYAYTGTGAARTNLAPVVAAITQDVGDIDPLKPGLQISPSALANYSASATDPNGDPLTWQWFYSLAGGPEVPYQSGAGTSPTMAFTYPAGSAGSSYLWKLRVSDGRSTTETRLNVDVAAGARAVGGLTFEAESGALSGPFVVSDGAISQMLSSGVSDGGRAVYALTITNTGDYVIQAVVDAPTYGERSFYVNVDTDPTDDSMLWKIPITTTYSTRTVSWLGNGTCTAPQFSPKAFHLTAGSHQLIIRGADANARLDRFTVLAAVQSVTLAASNIGWSGATLNGSLNSGGYEATNYFDFGATTDYGSQTVLVDAGHSTNFVSVSSVVTGLTPNTTYHFRLVGFNGNGVAYGADQSFSTAPAPTRVGNQFYVWVVTATGQVYYLEFKNNLNDTNWSPVTNLPGNGSVQGLVDQNATVKQRFYRVRVQ